MKAADSSQNSLKQKTSLNLLGGGVTGAFFHFGVLGALDDHLSHKATNYDVFVGTSAGSLVATACAVGLKPHDVIDAIIKEDKSLFHITRKDIYRFSLFDISSEIGKFIWTLFYLCYLKIDSPQEAPSFFWGLKDALPAGMFSMRYYERWIHSLFERHDFPTYFSQLKKELYIPAYDLDSCRRTVFGRPGFRHISFGKAISASSSIPIFFQPVGIEDRWYVDGGLGEIAHLDISAAAQAGLLIVVNPMVPVMNDSQNVKIKTIFEERGRIKDKGFTYIFDQGLRTELRLRVHAAINYLGYQFPNIDVLLIEPDDNDPTMFLYNPMEFDSRKQIVEYGYELTKRKLKQNSELWKRTLDKHQITMVGI